MDALLGWLMGILAIVWPGEPAADRAMHFGYVEVDTVLVAPARAGELADIAVQEGDRIEAGHELFRLDDAKERASLAAAEARMAASRARLADLKTGGRPEDIAVIADTLMRARADFELAQANFERSEKLRKQGVASVAQFDRDRSALRSAEARIREVEAQLAVARLPARDGQIEAASAELAAAEAERDHARLILADMGEAAPVAGIIEEVFYEPGEQVAPTRPVLSLRPKGALRIRFFVSTEVRGAYRPGASVSVGCEGCVERLTATVTRVATEAEFTPPVIFSLEERARLVFAVEARPDSADPALQPGQPVDVRPVETNSAGGGGTE